MKKLLGFIIAVILLLCLFGCSSTRKTIKEEASVAASQSTTTHSESDKATSSTASTEVKTNTNVVVDFTKVEYNDGTSDLLGECPAPENPIIINGNTSEKQEMQAKTTENSRKSSQKSAKTQETDKKQEQKSPTFGYIAPIYAAFVLLLIIAAVVLWWKLRKG